MASIVELREMTDEKLEEMLEDRREEIFNLRFQHASARLDDLSRLKRVRRDIAQLETVLRMRDLAVQQAIKQPEVAAALDGHEWQAETHFSYEDSAWRVNFVDEDGADLIDILVDLNKKRPRGRRARQAI